MPNLTLQRKFILFLVITLLVALTLNGALFLQLFASRSTEQHQQKIFRALEEIHEKLSSLSKRTLSVSRSLTQQKDLIASVNLINRYQDTENYQPLIFDAEKEKVARNLALQMRSVGIEVATVYDEDKEIVAFYLNKEDSILNGYISYRGGKRTVLVALGLSGEFLPYSKPLPSVLQSNSTDYIDGNSHSHFIVNHQTLFNTSVHYLLTTNSDGTEKQIGMVVVAHEVSAKILAATVAHLGVKLSILFAGTEPTNQLERLYLNEKMPPQPTLQQSHINGHTNTLIRRGGYLFSAASLPLLHSHKGTFIVGLKQEQIEQQLRDFGSAALIVLLITALFIIPLTIYLMNLNLLRPLKQLTDAILKLGKGEYTKIEGLKENNELGQLAYSFNVMVSELQDREEQLRTLSMATEQSPVAVMISRPDKMIEYVNPQFEIMTGYCDKEAIGQGMHFIYEQGEQDQTKIHHMESIISSGLGWSGEFIAQRKDGSTFTLRLSISAIKPAHGSISHYVSVAEDISEHQQSEAMLRNSQKMDAIGQLTGGVAHDFNNILGIIMGNLELLRINLDDRPAEQERIDRALSSTQRGAQLTQKLLSFSRQDSRGQKVIQINPIIADLQELIAKSLTATIQVETNLADNLWPISIDPGDLEDSILNLSLNARDAMPNGGLLVIETANKHLDANYVKQYTNAHEGDYVMISISDNGTGVNTEIQEKIFVPFFTTKERGKGTGLGLSMVYGFVQRSGGQIQLYSEEGQGTTIHIYIPRAEDSSDSPTVQKPKELPRGNETVLIVDDEETLAEIAESYLQQLGYQTIVAHSGTEALKIFSRRKDIALIFSDIVMPGGVDGYHLAFAAIEERPTIKILLTSGFTSKREEFTNGKRKIYLRLAENLLGKPYNLSELAIAIRHALDQ
ncbi:MAG: ATP-binding protein [Chromatiales bacterium]|nr:ATP-binding protein [Chromatiales bacterium]